ncbi:MAG: ribbon-helix-helix protein, CopG family [Devosia sp.]|nr:ribbon-helix-helix protein, CopG family [Devosia sp.]
MSTRVLTAHIPEELAEKVDRYAESMERSRAWIVKQALSNWVEWEEEKTRLSLEALEEADRIGTIPHEQMVAWAKSLGTDNPLPPPTPRKP